MRFVPQTAEYGIALLCFLIAAVIPRVSSAVLSNAPAPQETLAIVAIRTGAGVCSGTVIGPRVILTAASCLDEQPVTHATVEARSARCTAHPDFVKNITSDFALCVTKADLRTNRIEKILVDGHGLTTGQAVTVAGVGCLSAFSPNAVQTAGFNVGIARLSAREDPKSDHFWMVAHEIALCSADRGAGAFVTSNGAPAHLLVGVGSLSDGQAISWFSSTATAEFANWANSWATSNEVQICGLDSDASACQPHPHAPVPIAESVAVAPTSSSDLTRVQFEKEDTLRAVVSRVCPTADEAYFGALSKIGNSADVFGSLDKPIDHQGLVYIPACELLDNAPLTSFSTNDFDSVWAFWSWKFGAKGWPGQFERGDEKATDDSKIFLTTVQELNPDISKWSNLPKGMMIITPARSLRRAFTKSSEFRPSLSLIPQFSIPAIAADCKPISRNGDAYDMSALLDVLEEDRLRTSNKQIRPVEVAVADSGLYMKGVSPFPDSVLTGELSTQDKSNLEPLDDSFEMGHGTEVASLVLGGPLFARFQAIAGTRMTLSITRLYAFASSYVPNIDGNGLHSIQGYRVNQAAFTTFIENSELSEIVNLSLKSTVPMDDLKGKLASRSTTLFVIAAGNGDGKLGASDTKIYPAIYGGPTNPGAFNLITVASVDRDDYGNLRTAEFSDSGAEYVEIGAPGCSVPALSYDAKRRRWIVDHFSGTSVSAPLVTFAAALIESELRERIKAVAIKRRLLASADLNLSLSDDIADGRILNIAKAVNIFRDSVEPVGRPLAIGIAHFRVRGKQISDDGSVEFDCDGKKEAFAVHRILKLTPHYSGSPERPMRLYYLGGEPDSMFETKDCKVPADVSIEIYDDFEEADHSFALDLVSDYVRRGVVSH
jgi:subtilisin family serine protease